MPRAKKKTLGELIDEGALVDEKVATLNKELRLLQANKDLIKEAIIEALEEQGITSSGGKTHTASVHDEEVFAIEDFDKLGQFMVRNKAPYLLQRRLSAPAIRDLIDIRNGRVIPGLKKATIKKLSFRKRPK
jgi:hypothetical protein